MNCKLRESREKGLILNNIIGRMKVWEAQKKGEE